MKNHLSIILPNQLYHEVRNHLLENPAEEAAAFLLAGVHSTNRGIRILARRMINIPLALYRQKLEYHLDVAPKAINGLASLCEASNLTAIICHSHPRKISSVAYSPSDDHGEGRITTFLQDFVQNQPIGSLLFSESATIGRVWQARSFRPADAIITVGEIIRNLTDSEDNDHLASCERHSRQVMLLGKDGQSRLSKLSIGIVGIGGTGSCVAEQLARLGVAKLVLIDDDELEESNISRMYGTFPDQLRNSVIQIFRRKMLPKVDVIGKHLQRIDPKLTVEAINGNVVVSDIASKLLSCDAILLCTDEHWGRSIVNQISYQYFIPVVNMGVRVDAPNDVIIAAAGDVHTLGPDKPCLWCYGYLNSSRIAAESMLPEQRSARLREGYVEGIGPSPMVISLTSTVASLAVTELLHIFTGFRAEKSIKRLKWDILDGRVGYGGVQPTDRCLCHNVLAYGDLKPLPTHGEPDFVRKCRAKK